MNKLPIFGWLGLMVLTMLACSTPKMMVDDNLQTGTTIYNVKGRQGWLINQRLSFGEFQSSKVSRGWTKGYNFPFIIRFSGAKEKLSFGLKDAQDNQAEVFCLGKLREQDLQLFHRYFDINLKTKDAFTGTVALDKVEAYDFVVSNLNQNNWFREAEGWIKGKDLNIGIEPIKTLENGQKALDTQALGFSFVKDGVTLGAVELLNQGRIWLRDDLPQKEKLLLASVASALLLRSDLAGHNEVS